MVLLGTSTASRLRLLLSFCAMMLAFHAGGLYAGKLAQEGAGATACPCAIASANVIGPPHALALRAARTAANEAIYETVERKKV
eukprot:3420240-Rhodomonas_salina.3